MIDIWHYVLRDKVGTTQVVATEAEARELLIRYPDWRCEYRMPGR